ncbi:MAG: HemK2/MTQ2 family protein methyltransferase [Nanoarchaeota archaeon]
MYPVYEPHEDSYLLLKQVPKYAKGDVLDMGTGSGIIAVEAANYAKTVLAVDLNPLAVKYVHERTRHLSNLTVKQSNLFTYVTGRFDAIFFNAPYLPNDHRSKDIALDGGLNGYEVIDEFLIYAREHLKPEGVIVLLFSNHSKPEHIHQTIDTNGYKYKPVSRLKLDFEELYVYEIRINADGISRKGKARSRTSRNVERSTSSGKNTKPKKRRTKPHPKRS